MVFWDFVSIFRTGRFTCWPASGAKAEKLRFFTFLIPPTKKTQRHRPGSRPRLSGTQRGLLLSTSTSLEPVCMAGWETKRRYGAGLGDQMLFSCLSRYLVSTPSGAAAGSCASIVGLKSLQWTLVLLPAQSSNRVRKICSAAGQPGTWALMLAKRTPVLVWYTRDTVQEGEQGHSCAAVDTNCSGIYQTWGLKSQRPTAWVHFTPNLREGGRTCAVG